MKRLCPILRDAVSRMPVVCVCLELEYHQSKAMNHVSFLVLVQHPSFFCCTSRAGAVVVLTAHTLDHCAMCVSGSTAAGVDGGLWAAGPGVVQCTWKRVAACAVGGFGGTGSRCAGPCFLVASP